MLGCIHPQMSIGIEEKTEERSTKVTAWKTRRPDWLCQIPTIKSSRFMDENVALLHFGHREYVLFSFWKVGSDLGIVASILMVMLIGVLHDAILGLRIFLDREILLNTSETSSMHTQVNTNGGYSGESMKPTSLSALESGHAINFSCRRHSTTVGYFRRVLGGKRLMQTGLYAVQWSLFFTLVLIGCTFNIWLIIAAILGKSIGYLVFIGSPAFEAVERTSLKN